MRGVEDQPGWQFTDAWFLTAIGQFGRRGCSLSELIGAADALNHDVAPEPVAADSLGRLIASDLVSRDAQRFRGHRVRASDLQAPERWDVRTGDVGVRGPTEVPGTRRGAGLRAG